MGRPRGATAFSQSLILSALADSLTVEEAARKVGCTPANIFVRGKTDVDIRIAIKEQDRALEFKLAAAITKHRGVLSLVAQEVGLGSGVSVRYHIGRNPRLKQVFLEAREGVVDVAEDNVFRAVETGHLETSKWLLKTLGKDRGYTERREIEATHVRGVDRASTGELVGILEQLATSSPEQVEEVCRNLNNEERALLGNVLSRHALPEQTGADVLADVEEFESDGGGGVGGAVLSGVGVAVGQRDAASEQLTNRMVGSLV